MSPSLACRLSTPTKASKFHTDLAVFLTLWIKGF